ncbi:collagen alpha-1(I) chain-like [Otolemur garnettii]|uniref:collagen alpha-1(I) chain-like n=1 Tax=Otolemur garnettii TaxID=30611 RepID=UPI000C7F6CB1|nr:collagen alpha-1(I) chain-like [Otolemur garnettii]
MTAQLCACPGCPLGAGVASTREPRGGRGPWAGDAEPPPPRRGFPSAPAPRNPPPSSPPVALQPETASGRGGSRGRDTALTRVCPPRAAPEPSGPFPETTSAGTPGGDGAGTAPGLGRSALGDRKGPAQTAVADKLESHIKDGAQCPACNSTRKMVPVSLPYYGELMYHLTLGVRAREEHDLVSTTKK